VCKTKFWTPLHYACHHSCDLGSIHVVFQAHPSAVYIKDKEGKVPTDWLNPNFSPEKRGNVIKMLSQGGSVTTNEGIGGAVKAREEAHIEKLQFVRQVKVYTIPLAGIFRFVGGLHSVVEVSYGIYKESVWIERVGDNEKGNNVVFKYPTPSLDLRGFRMASGLQIKSGLCMYEVYEFAEACGTNPYCVGTNNCHVLAMDLFNFCLSESGKDERLIHDEELPNRVLATLAKYLPGTVSSGSELVDLDLSVLSLLHHQKVQPLGTRANKHYT
jgi:hypothetical protein